MTDIETRSFRVPFELRTDGENQTIVGYASTFDQPYPVDMVTEIIDRSAFTRTLSEKPDVYALIGHDPSRILGRTKNGTLSLSIDERGLKCIITPVMTRDAEDTLKLIASGCIDAMSFGFKVVKQAFGYADGKTTRRITDLELHEVSCVAFPANENATLSLRAKQMAKEFRASQETKEREFTATSSEERGRWEIDVELNGKTVFRYDSDSHNPDEEGYEPTEGGWMKNLTDYQGLADWMSHLGIMDKGETLVVDRGSNKGRYYARSSSTRLEKREAYNPIYYEYGVFQVKKEQVAFWNEVENETDENGNPITVGWYFNFRRGRTKDSDTAIGGVFKSKSEATNALNKRIEEETKKWENKWGDAESAFEASNPHRSSSTRLETRDWGNTSSKGVVIEVLRFKMDSNGNKTVMVKTSPNGRAQAIQTNGNLPKTHSMTDDVSDMGAVDLGTIADEVVKYLNLKPKNPNKTLIEAEGKRLDWKQNSTAIKLLELRNRIASPIDTETRGLADFALMASAGLGLFLVSKIVSGVLFFWYDCAYNTYGGGKKKVRVSAKTDKDAMAEVKKLNPDAQDIEVQKVKK